MEKEEPFESSRSQKPDWKNVASFFSRGSAILPGCCGLGGMGGHMGLETLSEKAGARSLTLSRLQLLGVGLTLQHTDTPHKIKQIF